MIDPVQSIRIAANLAERFREVVRPANPLLGQTISDLELRIGEAQQIYPEIWRHLDDARKALVARGVDVSAFDELRRGELAQLGVTDVDSRTEINYVALIAGGLRYQQVKTATFNVVGYQRAVAACKALMNAMPEVDFAALARAENQEIAAAGSLHANKWLGAVKWIAITAALAGAGIGIYKLATSGGDPDVNRAREESVSSEEARQARRERVEARAQRIADLTASFRDSCDPKQRAELAALYREDLRPSQAKAIETEACPPVPDCKTDLKLVERQIADQFDALKDSGWVSYCRAGTFGGKPGLAVVVNALGTDGVQRAYRGVAQPRGKPDLVPFAPAASTIQALEVADLDGDGNDEIVTANATGLVVSRVRDGKLVDVEGPPIAVLEGSGPCLANVELPGHQLLVVNVEAGATGKGCPKPGYHPYKLEGDALVERP